MNENGNGFAEGYAIGRDTNANCMSSGGAWGGDWAWWIVILLIFGWGNGNGFGGGFGGGAAQGYTLASDFATQQRQMSDGFNSIERKLDGVNNGLCDGFYTQAQLVNGINQNIASGNYNTLNAITTNGYESRLATTNMQNALTTQIADCCCKTQQNIKDSITQGVFNTNTITSAIKDCCCDNEKIAMQNRFDMAQYNCGTLQAIDKLGDRIIDYLANDKAQALRDENQALRLAASQQAQNSYLVNQLRPAPVPAYAVPNPYAYSGCGCNTGCGC